MEGRCININHPDFKDLLRKTGMNKISLKADVEMWMDRNDIDNIPSTKDLDVVYSSRTNQELYKSYNLLNINGSLKVLSFQEANKWAITNNQNAPYHFKVIKTPNGFSIGIQDKYSNLNKQQGKTIDKITSPIFKRDLDYYNNDVALFEQEQKDMEIEEELITPPNLPSIKPQC